MRKKSFTVIDEVSALLMRRFCAEQGVAEERKKKKKKNWEDAGANQGGLELVEALQIELARVPPLQMHEPEPLLSAPAPSKRKSKGKAEVQLQVSIVICEGQLILCPY